MTHIVAAGKQIYVDGVAVKLLADVEVETVANPVNHQDAVDMVAIRQSEDAEWSD